MRLLNFKTRLRANLSKTWPLFGPMLMGAVLLVSTLPAYAQFDSGSTGEDGALDFSGAPAGTIIEFNPTSFDPPLDQDGDNVYHFTSITVPADVTVRLRQGNIGAVPIHWFATGPVVIDGTIDLSGEDGHGATGLRGFSLPGPGGFSGGVGSRSPSLVPIEGFGFGGGCHGNGGIGGGGGYGSQGTSSACSTAGGEEYGNAFLLPLIGGSGGSGGGSSTGSDSASGGGAGGGAILIASSTSIAVNGAILSKGGNAPSGSVSRSGGGGSGGAIRLVAPIFSGSGLLSVSGGTATHGRGGSGRGLVEASQNNFGGTSSGDIRSISLSPNPILIAPGASTSIRIVSIGGVPAPAIPLGGFNSADVNIDTTQPVDIALEGKNIPLGTTVTVTVLNQAVGAIVAESTPLAGTEALSNATATMTIPTGFSQIVTNAKF